MITTLPFIVCLFWLIFLLLEWRRLSHAAHLLVLFVGVCSLLYLCHAIYFSGYSETYSFANTVYSFCNIAVFPMYYLYICRLTHVGKLPTKQWAVLVPAIIIGGWAIVDNFALPQNLALEALRINVAKAIFVVQLLLVAIYGWKRIRKFDRRIMEIYSDPDNKVANMTRDMLLILSICSMISVLFSYIGREYFVGKSLALYFPSVLFSGCLYAVCYIGYRQSFTADDMANDYKALNKGDDAASSECEHDAAKHQPYNHTQHAEYVKVCQMIEKNQWYRKADLRLPELALLVGIGRTRLSTLINDHSGMSFSDFINRYRVEYACKILKENAPDKETILADISVQCGFTSESSFYRCFKKATGMTPAQYRKKST